MNTRAFTLALIIAGIAMFMVHTYIEDQKSGIIKNYGIPKTVIVAKRDIKELELLDETKLMQVTVPERFVQPGSFSDIKALENTMTTIPIIKGEQLTKPRVTYPGAKTGLSRQVSPGKRAFGIQISEQQAVSKLIKPGDRVDVIVIVDYSQGKMDKKKVKTLLQDVLILSTGKNMTNSIPIYGVKTPQEIKTMKANVYERYNTVTLELTPYEIQKLVFAQQVYGYRPYFSLRNNNDQKRVRIKSSDVYDTLSEDEVAEAKSFFSGQRKN